MKLDRRDFLKLGAAASVGTLVGAVPARGAEPAASANTAATGKQQLIWGNLLHLGTNMWCDWDAPELKGDDSIYRPDLRCDQSLFHQASAIAGRSTNVSARDFRIFMNELSTWRLDYQVTLTLNWAL